MRKSKIAIFFSYPLAFCAPVNSGPRLNIAIAFGIAKTCGVWLLDGEKV